MTFGFLMRRYFDYPQSMFFYRNKNKLRTLIWNLGLLRNTCPIKRTLCGLKDVCTADNWSYMSDFHLFLVFMYTSSEGPRETVHARMMQ